MRVRGIKSIRERVSQMMRGKESKRMRGRRVNG